MNKYLADVQAEAILVRIEPAISAAIITTMLAAVLRNRTEIMKASSATTMLTYQISPHCISMYFHCGTE
ncbi:hypothetical protein D3C71_1576830 [compost metagenome]